MNSNTGAGPDRRSPLARVLGSGSAKAGVGHWWTQRVSSVALLILGLWFLIAILRLPGLAYDDVHAWLAAPFTAVLMTLLVATLAWHSNLGIQVVVEDYVHQPFLKISTIVLVTFLHVLVAAASIFAVLRVAFQ